MGSRNAIAMLVLALALAFWAGAVGCDRGPGADEVARQALEEAEREAAAEGAEPAPSQRGSAEDELHRSVRAAAAIRTAAHTDPSSLPRVLREHNLTAADFERMLRRIAEDREASMEFERLTGQSPR